MRKRITALSPSKIIFMFSLVVFIFAVFGDKGYIEYQLLLTQEQKLDKEISKLKADKLLWGEKVYSLYNNNSYYESLAREKLGYVKKNELMIVLEYN